MGEVDPQQEDFEESLVQSVIAENPPDEQGIREEWKKEIGWHRKEDIYSGLRRPKNNATSKVKGLKTQNAINKRQSSTLRLSYSSWAIFFLLVMLVVCIIVDRIKRGNSLKHDKMIR